MASNALEEKINKIRQQNEEIKRRHEEVETDKKNAAKLNALVQMVPSTDWPERKEPPEFSNPSPRSNHKLKSLTKEHSEQPQQYHVGGGDGKKIHVFAEGDGPPPDPKYNFLADSEREERFVEDARDSERGKVHSRPARGGFRRRGSGRNGHAKDYRGHETVPRESKPPEYEAWRAERNRIDEARISRQRTAEGNWRREWDNDKASIGDENSTREPRITIGDAIRRDHKDFDKRHHFDGWYNDKKDAVEYVNRGRGGNYRPFRGSQRGQHTNRGFHHSDSYEQGHGSILPVSAVTPLSLTNLDERTVIATDRSIKVTVNQGVTSPKGPVMSVKVNSPSIAGTGRVGPRQKTRITYSSQSEAEVVTHELDSFPRQKSFDDKSKSVYFNYDTNTQHSSAPKSPHPQRKKEGASKSLPYSQRKEFKKDEASMSSRPQKRGDESKSPYLRKKELKDSQKSSYGQGKSMFNYDPSKSSRTQKRIMEKSKDDSSKIIYPRKQESEGNSVEKLEDSTSPKPRRLESEDNISKEMTSRAEQDDNKSIESVEVSGVKTEVVSLDETMQNNSVATVNMNDKECNSESSINVANDSQDEDLNNVSQNDPTHNEKSIGEIVKITEREYTESCDTGESNGNDVESVDITDTTPNGSEDTKEVIHCKTKTTLNSSAKEITDGSKNEICDKYILATANEAINEKIENNSIVVEEVVTCEHETPNSLNSPLSELCSSDTVDKQTKEPDSSELQDTIVSEVILTQEETRKETIDNDKPIIQEETKSAQSIVKSKISESEESVLTTDDFKNQEIDQILPTSDAITGINSSVDSIESNHRQIITSDSSNNVDSTSEDKKEKDSLSNVNCIPEDKKEETQVTTTNTQ